MKNILTIIILLFSFTATKAQDLIVTNQGDSINCCAKLNKRKSEYRIGTKREYGIFWSKIPKEEVSVYIKNFYEKTPSVRLLGTNAPKEVPKWRFAIDAGAGKALKRRDSGIEFNIETNYLFHPYFSLGLLYKSFYCLSNDCSEQLHHITPIITFRIPIINSKDAFYCSYGIGFFYENSSYIKHSSTIFPSRIVSFSYDLNLNEHYAFGIRSTYALNDCRLSLSLGMRYLIWK